MAKPGYEKQTPWVPQCQLEFPRLFKPKLIMGPILPRWQIDRTVIWCFSRGLFYFIFIFTLLEFKGWDFTSEYIYIYYKGKYTSTYTRPMLRDHGSSTTSLLGQLWWLGGLCWFIRLRVGHALLPTSIILINTYFFKTSIPHPRLANDVPYHIYWIQILNFFWKSLKCTLWWWGDSCRWGEGGLSQILRGSKISVVIAFYLYQLGLLDFLFFELHLLLSECGMYKAPKHEGCVNIP